MNNLELINRLEALEDTAEATAWVIQMNDSVECVVIGTEADAKVRVEVERKAYFDRNPWSWVSFHPVGWAQMNAEQRRNEEWKAYKQRCYWRAHEYTIF